MSHTSIISIAEKLGEISPVGLYARELLGRAEMLVPVFTQHGVSLDRGAIPTWDTSVSSAREPTEFGRGRGRRVEYLGAWGELAKHLAGRNLTKTELKALVEVYADLIVALVVKLESEPLYMTREELKETARFLRKRKFGLWSTEIAVAIETAKHSHDEMARIAKRFQ